MTRTDPLRSCGEDAVADRLHQLRGDVVDAVVVRGVAGDLAEDAVLVGGREPGAAAGDDVAAGEGLHEGLLVRGWSARATAAREPGSRRVPGRGEVLDAQQAEDGAGGVGDQDRVEALGG